MSLKKIPLVVRAIIGGLILVGAAWCCFQWYSSYQQAHDSARQYADSLNPAELNQAETIQLADLKAQQDMAQAAMVMTVASIITAFVGAVSAGLLVWTFRAQQNLAKSQERARLEVLDGAIWPRMEHGMPCLHFEIALKNVGRTLASKVTFEGEVKFTPDEVPAKVVDWERNWETELDGEIITESVSGDFVAIPSGELDVVISIGETRIEFETLYGPKHFGSGGPTMGLVAASLVFFGKVKYQDIFGDMHILGFHFQTYCLDGDAPFYFGSSARNWRAGSYLEREQEAALRREDRLHNKRKADADRLKAFQARPNK